MDSLLLTEEERQEVSALMSLRRGLRYGSITLAIKDGRVLDFVIEQRTRITDLLPYGGVDPARS